MCLWSCTGSLTEEKRSSLFCKKNLGEIGQSSDRLNQSRTLNAVIQNVCRWHYKEQIRNIFWAFIILTHASVFEELHFIIYTRGEGSWYFRPRSRGGLATFTPIAGMGHLISELKSKFLRPPPPLLISDKSLTIKTFVPYNSGVLDSQFEVPVQITLKERLM